VFLFELKDQVAWITLNNSQTRNALSLSLAEAMLSQIKAVSESNAKALVIYGEKHFMSGGDINYLANAVFARDEAAVLRLVDTAHQLVLSLLSLRIPVIASVEGSCAGYGMSLLTHCDMALASTQSKFVTAYSGIGANPDGGLTFSLPRLVGQKNALELLTFNELFDAEKALKIGLVNKVVSPEHLVQETADWCAKLTQCSSTVFSQNKHLINRQKIPELKIQLEKERNIFKSNVSSPDLAEGLNAFINKRKPNFA
jgi:2-(1,2-epoxy-1,2-dihydrophenyl)acetyl-CoA isomerase